MKTRIGGRGDANRMTGKDWLKMADLWTESQRKAWQYVEKGVSTSLTQTQALKEFRAGGGKIRTQSWVELWHRSSEASQEWNKLYQLKGSDTIPSSMYEQVNINYQKKYVMTFTVDIRASTGEVIRNIHRQVESSHKLSLQQWTVAVEESMSEDLSDPALSVNAIRELKFFERTT